MLRPGGGPDVMCTWLAGVLPFPRSADPLEVPATIFRQVRTAEPSADTVHRVAVQHVEPFPRKTKLSVFVGGPFADELRVDMLVSASCE